MMLHIRLLILPGQIEQATKEFDRRISCFFYIIIIINY